MTDNKINYIINGVLAIGITILFVIQLREDSPDNNDTPEQHQESPNYLPVAYINVDSLLLNYYLAIDFRSHLTVKEENARSIITKRVREVEADMRRYKQKLEENPFYPREESNKEYTRILEKQQDIYNLDNQLSLDLKEEQDKIYQVLYDSIIKQIEKYNEDGRYKVIFSNTSEDNILYAEDVYNITKEVIDFLNHNATSPALNRQSNEE